MVKVKICGITNARDGRAAARLGADALGFNFVPGSPRQVTRDRARAIIASLPPLVTVVGVFADEEIEAVRETCDYCGIRTVQLHGGETPAYLSRLPRLKRIKAVRIRTRRDLARLGRYTCEAYLLDAYVPGRLGGTGKTFNWEWVRSTPVDGPVILSGGLNPDNVADAVRVARPYAVDVASGVESAPGKKDRTLMAAFIARAKRLVR